MENREEIIKELAPISLVRRQNPFDIKFEEALASLAAPSHLSEEVSTEKAYMFLVQYRSRVERLLASYNEILECTLDTLRYCAEYKEGQPCIQQDIDAYTKIYWDLKRESEALQ